MGKSAIYVIFIFLFSNCVGSDLYRDILRKVDPCESFCEKTYPTSTEGKLGTCCRRGCRFFNLIYMVEDRVRVDFNATRNTCQASCMEAYAHTKDRYACNLGCASMAHHKQAELLSRIDWSLYVENGSPLLLGQGDTEPDDVLTDPGLRSQLRRTYVLGGASNKLPETHIKTLPINADPAEAGSQLQRTGTISSSWFDCVVLRQGVPFALTAVVVLLPFLFALWLCLVPSWRFTLEEVETLGDYKDPFDLLPKYSLYVDKI